MPTEADAVRALADSVGERTAEGLWALAARDLGLSRPVRASADLRRVSEHLMQVGELSRVAGRSLKVRVITYEALKRSTSS